MSDEFTPDFPAFPVAAGNQVYCSGMDLRDYMAGQALAGFAGYSGDRADVLSANPNLVAKTAYVWADAMLKARRND